MRYLLDSDAVIDCLSHIDLTLRLVERLAAGGNTICTCAVVVSEVYSGTAPARQKEASDFLEACEFLGMSAASARRAGEWRYSFARQGVSLGTPDALIAATAAEHAASVVTGNISDFPMPEIELVPLPRVRR